MLRLLFLALLLGSASVHAQDWQLVWSDEFDVDGAPDPANWNYDIGGHGWGNAERQFYTDRTDNARVEDGVLVIEAREEEYEGNDYTSARLVTRGTAAWTYGRIEARIKLPFGQGIWPAFWMLPTDSPYGGWPVGGEIDIMEYLGHETSRVHGTLHYGGGSIGHRYTGTSYDLPEGSFDEDFHTFAIEWEPRRIRWYVDGELYQTQISWTSAGGPYPAPFDSPFHLLLNVAVGGQWPGYPDETTTFPQRMEVDYVRVYQDAEAYPEVGLADPSGGGTVEAGATLTLEATAEDNDPIEEVRFLQGDGVLGADIFAPYGLTVEGVVDGCYALSAQATDAVGYTGRSEPVDLVVGEGCPDGTAWPYLMRPAEVPGVVQAEYFDLGGADVAYRDFSSANTGEGIRLGEGVDLRPSKDDGGGHDLTDVSAREWVTYTIDVAEAGRYRVQARMASGVGGTVRLSLDGDDLTEDIALPPTGGDITYRNEVIAEVELPAGRHVFRVDFRSGGLSINNFRFNYLGGVAVEDDAPGGLGLRVAPTPAAGRARIAFELPTSGPVLVRVLDALGREVRRVMAEDLAAGDHATEVDLSGLAPGVYTVTLAAGRDLRSAPLVVVR
ncbi:family 16 glycosylhydrolase [Rubrivirga marina]|uniref:GH16 domain-containing protein n=1 Tax=Rubrivirga marina TaxID=1196024 RepID=A0A271J194_9BACT|nr:family 16 glycosylhydrolase [Rubrivirga marina]PAP77130.1 hypothetical protein BSZ37_12180 [Rubrivirga marina]